MTIEGIGPIDPITKYNKTGKPEKVDKGKKADSINVSEEARSKAEIYQAAETAKNAQEIRWDRVEEVKQKLEDPNYISDKVIEAVAEKIMDQFNT
ncbi:MAG: flagellar biosynthesis anti-sigma factor FlgM [Spirochaetales bacterium]|nr:flagellar biosynthesis anti-sigma factor FlgM [Spirochaetales bacterium]